MKSFTCPRCRYPSEQPDHVLAVWHQCRPPGRIAKYSELIADDPVGETNKKPTRSQQKP